MTYFEVFGLPPRLVIDADELQQRFYALSRRHHPDFHQAADAGAQAQALEASALVNAAYRTLRDPIARVEYLLRLEEGGAAPQRVPGRVTVPSELLEEMFEIQEALADARQGRIDEAARGRLRAERARLEERRATQERQLSETFASAWDEAGEQDRPRVLAAVRRALATRAYLRTVIDDLSAVLGKNEESLVSNRRH